MLPLKDDNPTINTPFVTVGLIVLNVIVFVFQFMSGPETGQRLVYQFGVIPYELISGTELTPTTSFPILGTVFTSMFMHGGIMHLVGNMLYLWIFGNNIEDCLGPVRFIVFYLLSGVCAVLLFTGLGPESQVPMIGASGAVSGVLGAYILHFPRARVMTLFTFGFFWRFIWIRAWFVLGFWIVIQLLFGLPTVGGATTGGVAYMAHIGGFLFGLLGGLVFRGRFQEAKSRAQVYTLRRDGF